MVPPDLLGSNTISQGLQDKISDTIEATSIQPSSSPEPLQMATKSRPSPLPISDIRNIYNTRNIFTRTLPFATSKTVSKFPILV